MKNIKEFKGKSLLTIAEREYLLQLAQKGGWFLEIGTASGASIGWIAQQCPDTQFLSIELYSLKVPSTWERILQWRENSSPNQILLIGTSLDYDSLHPHRKFDTIFIDGNHSEEWVTTDIQTVLSYTAPGTVMAFHDYHVKPDSWQGGVPVAVDKWYESADGLGWEVDMTVNKIQAFKRYKR